MLFEDRLVLEYPCVLQSTSLLYGIYDVELVIVNALSNGNDGNSKKERTIETDMVVHGAGRVPDIDCLDLEAGGIDYDQKKRHKS
jgi:hypothetical protein